MSKIKDVVIDEMNRLREIEHEELGDQRVGEMVDEREEKGESEDIGYLKNGT